MTKLLFDAETHRIIGAGIVGTNAGDLIAEVALAIEMGCRRGRHRLTIHPHPTLGKPSAWRPRRSKGTDRPAAGAEVGWRSGLRLPARSRLATLGSSHGPR